MMRGLAVLLCALMVVSGCRSWNMSVFNVPVQSSEYNTSVKTVDIEKPVVASEWGDLSREEKTGVIVVLIVAAAAIAGGIALAVN